MGIIRNFIKGIVPYNLIMRRNRVRFMDQYLEWKKTNDDREFDDTSMFDSIVSVQGFGYSGSGAVVDLLREYDDTKVLGYVSPIGSKTSKQEDVGELDFFRQTGGLLHIGHMMEKQPLPSLFWNDVALKEYTKLIYHSLTFKKIPELRWIFFRFFERIVEQSIYTPKKMPFNGYLDPYGQEHYMHFLKPMTQQHYQELCKRMFYTIFNTLYKPQYKRIVLDQMFGDCGFGEELYQGYLPGAKQVVVYRDPRDVYAIALKLDVNWVSHDTVDSYIKWTEIAYRSFSPSLTNCLPVRFEDLIYDYEKLTKRIEDYLQLSPAHHTMKKENFDPAVSCKTVGLWKTFPERKAEFDKIKEAFPGLCYK